jgi:amino-acid N-acetyltransferase
MSTTAEPSPVRKAAAADLTRVRALLTEAGLPLDGLDAATVILVADAGGSVVGAIALEQHGSGPERAFLLRSAVVEPAWRGRGIGVALTRAALAEVDAAGAAVALLTETAADWFRRFGFVPADRSCLPRVLEASEELRGACPVSAQAMLRTPPSRPSP